jgi:hypothetical protein
VSDGACRKAQVLCASPHLSSSETCIHTSFRAAHRHIRIPQAVGDVTLGRSGCKPLGTARSYTYTTCSGRRLCSRAQLVCGRATKGIDGRRRGGQQGRRGQPGGALTARAAPRSRAPTRHARRRTARRRAPPAAGDAPPSPPRSRLWRTGSRRNSLPAGCKSKQIVNLSTHKTLKQTSRPVSRPTASSYKYQHRPAWARRLRAAGHDATAVSWRGGAWGETALSGARGAHRRSWRAGGSPARRVLPPGRRPGGGGGRGRSCPADRVPHRTRSSPPSSRSMWRVCRPRVTGACACACWWWWWLCQAVCLPGHGEAPCVSNGSRTGTGTAASERSSTIPARRDRSRRVRHAARRSTDLTGGAESAQR